MEGRKAARDDRLHRAIETTDRVMGCTRCGSQAAVEDRSKVVLADLPAFGSLVWMKRCWSCPEPNCGVGSFLEDRPDIAPGRAVMAARPGMWATREVGVEIHTVAYAAAQLGVGWHTVMDTVSFWAAR